jgi:hypothetical protein
MGQQQLLLITLTVIIVGAAIAPISYIFRSQAVQANREAIIGDLVNLSAKAQKYYRIPQTLGGGGGSFDGFFLSPQDTGNANGSYSISTRLPNDASFVAGNTLPVSNSSSFIYIIGCGKETGDDGVNPVKCFIKVEKSATNVTILN